MVPARLPSGLHNGPETTAHQGAAAMPKSAEPSHPFSFGHVLGTNENTYSILLIKRSRTGRSRTGQPDGSCWRKPPTRRSAPTDWSVLPFRGHCFFRIPRNARCIILEMAYHVIQRGTNHQRVFFSASDHAAYPRPPQQSLVPAESCATV